jgi:hypothetical protein
MQFSAQLQGLTQTLNAAKRQLERDGQNYPLLNPAICALRRLAQRVNRPLRVAILGESNAGKSSIANGILGDVMLPALPVANTRLPVLLRYAPAAAVSAVWANGQSLNLAPQEDYSLDQVIRLDVTLPLDTLRGLELLDFPGSSDPLFHVDLSTLRWHRPDAAIWATAATQAWRETERAAWMSLPPKLRKHGILAVTHSDLIASDDDFKNLEGRLRTVAAAHFAGICFLSAAKVQMQNVFAKPLVHASINHGVAGVFDQLAAIKRDFEMERVENAVAVTRRIATRTLSRLEQQQAGTDAGP